MFFIAPKVFLDQNWSDGIEWKSRDEWVFMRVSLMHLFIWLFLFLFASYFIPLLMKPWDFLLKWDFSSNQVFPPPFVFWFSLALNWCCVVTSLCSLEITHRFVRQEYKFYVVSPLLEFSSDSWRCFSTQLELLFSCSLLELSTIYFTSHHIKFLFCYFAAYRLLDE